MAAAPGGQPWRRECTLVLGSAAGRGGVVLKGAGECFLAGGHLDSAGVEIRLT
ncbi:MAG: hypothetical protein IPK82_03780 [Polyangiaceae bacterium]|nr:hypothetical protein [Polyangiaceae bacterium]